LGLFVSFSCIVDTSGLNLVSGNNFGSLFEDSFTGVFVGNNLKLERNGFLKVVNPKGTALQIRGNHVARSSLGLFLNGSSGRGVFFP